MIYPLCSQTVAIYNAGGGENAWRETVIKGGAFLEESRGETENGLGRAARRGFLLVIPQGADGKTFIPPHEFDPDTARAGEYTLRAGDRVLRGLGGEPEPPPPHRADVNTVSMTRVMRGPDGRVTHVEAT
ncbi:MAG: hypothetical protein FWH06_07315 [Oscillospiraceae bacterium]|nr:hypothetical protein [Oscillospiraceae bacterium]